MISIGNSQGSMDTQKLASLKYLATFSPHTWLRIGDFNEILEDPEKQRGARRLGAQMEEFKHSLEYCQLSDMGFTGSRFTWLNMRRDDQFTKERLDRVVATTYFATFFPQLTMEVLAARNVAPLHASTGLLAGNVVDIDTFGMKHGCKGNLISSRLLNRCGKRRLGSRNLGEH